MKYFNGLNNFILPKEILNNAKIKKYISYLFMEKNYFGNMELFILYIRTYISPDIYDKVIYLIIYELFEKNDALQIFSIPPDDYIKLTLKKMKWDTLSSDKKLTTIIDLISKKLSQLYIDDEYNQNYYFDYSFKKYFRIMQIHFLKNLFINHNYKYILYYYYTDSYCNNKIKYRLENTPQKLYDFILQAIINNHYYGKYDVDYLIELIISKNLPNFVEKMLLVKTNQNAFTNSIQNYINQYYEKRNNDIIRNIAMMIKFGYPRYLSEDLPIYIPYFFPLNERYNLIFNIHWDKIKLLYRKLPREIVSIIIKYLINMELNHYGYEGKSYETFKYQHINKYNHMV